MWTKKYFVWIVCVIFIISIAGCSEKIDQKIQSLNKLKPPKPPLSSPAQIGEPVTSEESSYSCTTQRYEAPPGFDTLMALDFQQDVIWPGSIIDAATIDSGEYTPITLERGPLTFSTSLHMEKVRSEMKTPSLSHFRQAREKILPQETSVQTPADITSSVIRIHSKRHLQVELGASGKKGLHTLEGMFKFSNENIQQRYLVKFIQVYYTIDVDPPARPGDFFAPTVTWNDLQAQISDGETLPMYVSSITYGRMALFCFTTEDNSMQIDAALRYAYDGKVFEAEVDTRLEYSEALSSLSMGSYIIGGSGDAAANAVIGGGMLGGEEAIHAINEYIKSGDNYSKESPGAPLSYSLRYLDNSPGKIVMSTEYTVRTCVPPEIREDFEEGDGGWTVDGGRIEDGTEDESERLWFNGDELCNKSGDEPGDKSGYSCKGCHDPCDEDRGNFIQWIDDEGAQYGHYIAPSTFTGQVSGDYVNGKLQYWLFHDRIDSTGEWVKNQGAADVTLKARNGTKLYFKAKDSRNTDDLGISICKDQEWQELSINLFKGAYKYPHCWFKEDETDCAEDDVIRGVLADLGNLYIRAEYWGKSDKGFLDDVRITPPQSR
jgi:hypothetical protein